MNNTCLYRVIRLLLMLAILFTIHRLLHVFACQLFSKIKKRGTKKFIDIMIHKGYEWLEELEEKLPINDSKFAEKGGDIAFIIDEMLEGSEIIKGNR